MTLPKGARHLSVRNRHSSWLSHYPDASFWAPWHMSLLAHGGVVADRRSTAFMASLYATNELRTPAAEHLLRFEQRTILGHLPGETRCSRNLLLGLLRDSAGATDLAPFWGDLPGHVGKHLNAEERPHLDASARALRAYVQQRRAVGSTVLDAFFPGAVADEDGYARLARAVLFVAVLEGTPLLFTLYCPRSNEYAPNTALTVNIDVPVSFLAAHGQRAEREVKLGVALAFAEPVSVPGGSLDVPVLIADPFFTTLFAPRPQVAGMMRDAGRSASLYLQ